VERQKVISFDYDGLWFDNACRVDLVVENCVIVEVKSAEKLIPLFERQLLTYLRVSGYPLGLLLNFGCERMKDGLKRIANWPLP
jgi:iron complex transport system substrate-binding protein